MVFLTPYFDRAVFRSFTQLRSSIPRIALKLTPGRSFILPFLNIITECSTKLCQFPWTPTKILTLNETLTLTTFLRAELGFLGFIVKTLIQIPFLFGIL